MRCSKKFLTERLHSSIIWSPHGLGTHTLGLRRGVHRVGLKSGATLQDHGLVFASSKGITLDAHNVVNGYFENKAAPDRYGYFPFATIRTVPPQSGQQLTAPGHTLSFTPARRPRAACSPAPPA